LTLDADHERGFRGSGGPITRSFVLHILALPASGSSSTSSIAHVRPRKVARAISREKALSAGPFP
jgi:hypothetical protein